MSDRKEAKEILIEGLPTACAECGALICLRQQVLNLALGEDETLLCLPCLAQDNESSSEELLVRLAQYIQGRDCFLKEWSRYCDRSYCPNPDGCLPAVCFGSGT
ncbi:MAG: hypothetical protein K2Y32_07545 [Candidatus Obscuribacterales bacterium]|nr:hypothetical protein [Candidatus Obscuribacterales bacterium]